MAVDPPFIPKDRTYSAAEIAWFVENSNTFKFAGRNDKIIAVAVALAESGGRQNAHNTKPPDDSLGLWQINMYGKLGPARRAQFNLKHNTDLFDPVTNANVAGTIRLLSGWQAWSTYKSGAYKKHMVPAAAGIDNPKQPSGIGGGEGSVDERVGGKVVDAVFDPLFNFVRDAGLRLAGFVGGAALLIGALILLAKRGVK